MTKSGRFFDEVYPSEISEIFCPSVLAKNMSIFCVPLHFSRAKYLSNFCDLQFPLNSPFKEGRCRKGVEYYQPLNFKRVKGNGVRNALAA